MFKGFPVFVGPISGGLFRSYFSINISDLCCHISQLTYTTVGLTKYGQ